MPEARLDVQLADGLVIPRSISKTLGWIFLCLITFPGGCFLVWGKLRNVFFDEFPGSREVTLYGFVLGLVLVVTGPLATYQLSRSLLVRRRLVIGDDRLQIQERHHGIYVAVLQIPFANIAQVQYEVTTTDRQVSIDLKAPDDPETFGEGIQPNTNMLGHHYCITEAFRASAFEINEEIQRAMNRWASNLAAAPRPVAGTRGRRRR